MSWQDFFSALQVWLFWVLLIHLGISSSSHPLRWPVMISTDALNTDISVVVFGWRPFKVAHAVWAFRVQGYASRNKTGFIFAIASWSVRIIWFFNKLFLCQLNATQTFPSIRPKKKPSEIFRKQENCSLNSSNFNSSSFEFANRSFIHILCNKQTKQEQRKKTSGAYLCP